MPTLKRPKKASTDVRDYGSLAEVVAALKRAAGAVAQAEEEETEAILAARRAKESLKLNVAAVECGAMPQSAVERAQADIVKTERAREAAVERAGIARLTLQGLEERHAIALDEARSIAAEHYATEIQTATQTFADALVAAAHASAVLDDVLNRADVAGVRTPHRGSCLPWTSELAFKTKESTGGGRGAPVLVNTRLGGWLDEARDAGYDVPNVVAAPHGRGHTIVRQSELQR